MTKLLIYLLVYFAGAFTSWIIFKWLTEGDIEQAKYESSLKGFGEGKKRLENIGKREYKKK